MDQVRALGKWIASFKKADWVLEDYPLRFTEREVTVVVGRWADIPWSVQIVNWGHMRGDGISREEALHQLRERFEAYRAKHQRLPRPGRGAPFELEIASQELVAQHAAVVRDLLERVIGLDPDQCLVTDESSLWDFHDEDSNSAYFIKISLLYGIDVSDVHPPTLTNIAVRLEESGAVRSLIGEEDEERGPHWGEELDWDL